MAYSIGQLRSSQLTADNMYEVIATSGTITKLSNYKQSILLSTTLVKNTSYLFSFNLRLSATPSEIITVNIKLINENEEEYIVDTQKIISNNTPTIQSFFSPKNNCNKIIVELVPLGSLTLTSIGNSFKGMILKELLGTKIDAGIEGIAQLGVQGPAGMIIVINGESIKLGRFGVYELDEEKIKVTSLKIYPNGNDFFFIDYKY